MCVNLKLIGQLILCTSLVYKPWLLIIKFDLEEDKNEITSEKLEWSWKLFMLDNQNTIQDYPW